MQKSNLQNTLVVHLLAKKKTNNLTDTGAKSNCSVFIVAVLCQTGAKHSQDPLNGVFDDDLTTRGLQRIFFSVTGIQVVMLGVYHR